MSNLAKRPALHPNWHLWGLGALKAFRTVIIAIFDPMSENNGTDYNPFKQGKTSVPKLLYTGAAQMAVFRQTLNADDVAGSVTQVRSVRFTTDLNGPDLPVRKGLIVRVTSCPHDRDAEQYEYTVTSGINSGLAWMRTIEAESDMAVVVGPITEYTV